MDNRYDDYTPEYKADDLNNTENTYKSDNNFSSAAESFNDIQENAEPFNGWHSSNGSIYGDFTPSKAETTYDLSAKTDTLDGTITNNLSNSSYRNSFYQPPVTAKVKTKKGGKAIALFLAFAFLTTALIGSIAYIYVSHNKSSNKQSSLSSSLDYLTQVSNKTENESTDPDSNETDATSFKANDIASVSQKASPSVVEIYTEVYQQSRYRGGYITTGAGSGVIITSDGFIVTNHHVIDGATKVTVRTNDGTEYEALLIGSDSSNDLAVLKIQAENLTAAQFADSDDVVVGELAVAIGNPLGTLGGTVTEGIISAKDREIKLSDTAMRLLQTSAAVNPGNSGGGLFNGNGELVGVIVAKSIGDDIEGLGFAIPSNLAKETTQKIISQWDGLTNLLSQNSSSQNNSYDDLEQFLEEFYSRAS